MVTINKTIFSLSAIITLFATSCCWRDVEIAEDFIDGEISLIGKIAEESAGAATDSQQPASPGIKVNIIKK